MDKLDQPEVINAYIKRHKQSNPKFIFNIHHRAKELIKELDQDQDNTFTQNKKQNYILHLENMVLFCDNDYNVRKCGIQIRRTYTWVNSIHHAWLKAKARVKSMKNYRNFVSSYCAKAQIRHLDQQQLHDLERKYLKHIEGLCLVSEGGIRDEWYFDYSQVRTKNKFCKYAKGFRTFATSEEKIAVAMAKVEIFERILSERNVSLLNNLDVVKFPHFGLSGSASTSSNFKVNYKL